MPRLSALLASFCLVIYVGLLASCGGTSSNNSNNPSASAPGTGGGSGSGSSGSGSGGSGSAGSGSSGSGSGSGSGAGSSTAAIAYVSGTNNDFDGVRVDSNGNVSATLGSPYSQPSTVENFAINNHLLLVASQGSSTASETSFRADQDGNLAALTTTALAADVNTFGFALDASGNFAYVGGNSGIYGYAVNHDTGALTPLPGSPFPASSPHGWANIVVAPNGSRLCAVFPALKSLASVVCFVRHSDGTLDTTTQGQNKPAQNTGTGVSLAITQDSAYLIWTDLGAGTVNASPIANNTGQSSGTTHSGGQPGEVANSGPWVAVANSQPNNIAIFTVNSSGQITSAGSPVSIASQPGEVAFSADGAHLFVSTESGLLSFSFNKSTGALQPLNGGNPTPGGRLAVTAE